MIKKINFKKNKNDVFVTFWWVVDMHRNYVLIAIRCKDYENAREVASDEYLSNKCNFDKIYNEYWEKMFKVL